MSLSASTMPRVVALCGQRRSGKDTIANYLVTGYGYEHIKITAPLKTVCKTLFHFTDDQLETDIKEVVDPRWGVSPRQVMQFVGTEVFQYKIQELLPQFGRNFWINSLTALVDNNPTKRYVISDLRFTHEHVSLCRYDILTIKVASNRVQQNSTDQHQSECEYKDIKEDFFMINNGTKEDLYAKIDTVFTMYEKKV
ncbi:deoxynucleoside monophosphate kinase [Dishui Lake large algae virus 1]|nr:deoxynucleoside monophosphate kinase [Dishui Lake large algae virus 1]